MKKLITPKVNEEHFDVFIIFPNENVVFFCSLNLILWYEEKMVRQILSSRFQ